MRKTIVIAILGLLTASCSSVKNYVTFSGKVQGNTENLTLANKKKQFHRTLKPSANGIFKDTFKLKEPSYFILSDGTNKGVVYLKNGDNINMNLNTNKFIEMSFVGNGSEESSYMAKKAYMQNSFFADSLFYKTQTQFENKLNAYSQILEEELAKAKDSTFKLKQAKYIKSFKRKAKSRYKFKHYLVTNLGKGTPAPDFSYPYEDANGNKVTLKSLKGKYLYIKFWATWCAYCRKEDPYYKKIAKKFKDKNIEFVSISIDKPKAKERWKSMVTKSKFNGIELFSNEDKEFKKTYKLNQIPRFMLIDPQGNIIDTDLIEPSKGTMETILSKLN